jgi:hypothetical protein
MTTGRKSGAVYVEEPTAIQLTLRSLSECGQAAPKDWADSYASAFAQASGLRFVTFDQTLQKKNSRRRLAEPHPETMKLRSENQIPLAQHLQLDPSLQRQGIHR